MFLFAVLNVLQNNCRKIAVQQIFQMNTWAKPDHTLKKTTTKNKKTPSPITKLKVNFFIDIFQGFYFENPQQIFYRMAL